MKFSFIRNLLLMLGLNLCFISISFGQQSDSTLKYAVVIKFQSICCGVPNAAPLKKFVSKFKKEYHTKTIRADKIGPMGREGEYYLGFKLKELTRKQKYYFLKKVTVVTSKLTDKGKAIAEENVIIDKSTLPQIATITKVYYWFT